MQVTNDCFAPFHQLLQRAADGPAWVRIDELCDCQNKFLKLEEHQVLSLG
jgi:hypothetical protein